MRCCCVKLVKSLQLFVLGRSLVPSLKCFIESLWTFYKSIVYPASLYYREHRKHFKLTKVYRTVRNNRINKITLNNLQHFLPLYPPEVHMFSLISSVMKMQTCGPMWAKDHPQEDLCCSVPRTDGHCFPGFNSKSISILMDLKICQTSFRNPLTVLDPFSLSSLFDKTLLCFPFPQSKGCKIATLSNINCSTLTFCIYQLSSKTLQ